MPPASAAPSREHWISRPIEVQDLAPVVADDEKAIQNTKPERWHCEKVHRSNCLTMIPEER
jgi:hypothetical protein